MIMRLKDTEVLVVDCQATSSKPDHGNILELGWARVRPTAGDGIIGPVESLLIKPGPDNTIPRHVLRITGISETKLKSAAELSEAWSALHSAALGTAKRNGRTRCPTVIHFASYEKSFLQYLLNQFHPRKTFPFDITCTHKISKILFKDLPRKGLRAIAGYLGHSLPEQRRCRFHVEGTGFIWCRVVEILERDHGIHTMDELNQWLSAAKIPKMKSFQYPLQDRLRKELPDTPGIYRMLRSNGDLLYIGKSKSIKKRINSYFAPKTRHAEHILEMLTQARGIDYQITSTALDAAILESDEIGRYEPPYNIALKPVNPALIFCSKDFLEQSGVPDRAHRVGPFPSRGLLPAISLIRKVLKGHPIEWNEPSAWISAFQDNPDYAPDPDSFKKGCDLFLSEYGRRIATRSFYRYLTREGAEFWKKHLEKKQHNPDETEDRASQADGLAEDRIREPGWTPEAVSKWIQGLIMHTSLLIRRARFFVMLMESSVSWESKADPLTGHLKQIRHGEFSPSTEVGHGTVLPSPPEASLAFRERRKHFNPASYQRLRILVTELRRIMKGDRTVRICLRPEKTLGPGQVAGLLEWL